MLAGLLPPSAAPPTRQSPSPHLPAAAQRHTAPPTPASTKQYLSTIQSATADPLYHLAATLPHTLCGAGSSSHTSYRTNKTVPLIQSPTASQPYTLQKHPSTKLQSSHQRSHFWCRKQKGIRTLLFSMHRSYISTVSKPVMLRPVH